MKIVFLRGSIPPANEHPEKLLYDSIENCEDNWTQLFYYLTKKFNAHGELLYQGGIREFRVDDNFTERWVQKLKKYSPKYKPDLIISRGGFPFYDDFITKYSKAKKIYYGAGTRFYPQTDFTNYDLFLVDSQKQRHQIKAKGKRVSLFIKPAATLFKPYNVKKEYDICFMANASQSAIKRHKLLLKSFSNTKYKILNLGNKDKSLIKLAKKLNVDITWEGWDLRKNLPEKISKCKVGICCSTNYDSCPRVIPEYLACGLPIVVTNNMNFWQEKYITKESGILVDENKLLYGVKSVLNKTYNIKKFYDNNINMDIAVDNIYKTIEKILY